MNQNNTSSPIISVADMVESNGLTVKENNLKKDHVIPLFTMVEFNSDGSYDMHENGLRYYVQGHSRDCDGTPLYRLTSDVKMVGKHIELRDAITAIQKDILQGIFVAVDFGKITGNYSANSLTVIRSAEEIIKRLQENEILDENCNFIE